MDAQVTERPSPEEMRRILLAEYQEVCRNHAGITDFRAKLLALLPIASGTGVGVLVTQVKGELSKIGAGLLIALGVFGAIVTFGLFLYELRQIDVCKQLRNHAAWIERQLGIDAGQFGGRRGRLSLREVYSRRLHREREEGLREQETSARQENPSQRSKEHVGALGKPFVGAETAGYVIYHAVLAAWLFVAGVGVAKLLSD